MPNQLRGAADTFAQYARYAQQMNESIQSANRQLALDMFGDGRKSHDLYLSGPANLSDIQYALDKYRQKYGRSPDDLFLDPVEFTKICVQHYGSSGYGRDELRYYHVTHSVRIRPGHKSPADVAWSADVLEAACLE